ncbi:MAG: hypothetical protein LLG06_14025, partial [Desulfobacteraceae bacterium]|nr:hypothetical protein [Desulfobacteraceae bacterium]
DYCEGALVGGLWSPITRQLKDGDSVEIISSSEPLDVDPDLEDLCKTPKARAAINRQLQQRRLRFAQETGRDILLQEIIRNKLPSSVLEGENFRLILEILNLKDPQELYIQIGQDLKSPGVVLYYLEGHGPDEEKKPGPEHVERNTISVPTLDKAIFKFARCCNPLPGQENVVATLSERGVTFHNGDCQDLHQRHSLQPKQMLQVHWNTRAVWKHPLVFDVHIYEQSLRKLLPALTSLPEKIKILHISGTTGKNDCEIVILRVVLHSFDEARKLFGGLPTERTVIEEFGREGGPRHFRAGI